MNKPKIEKPRGVVGLNQAQQNFSLERFFPSDQLKHFIEHYWLISWDLPHGTTHTQHVISHPCIHLTFIQNNSSITGIVTKRFEHTLSGQGNLVGIRFTPAGFYTFAQTANTNMLDMTNKTFPIDDFFDFDIKTFETEILGLSNPTDKTQKIEQEILPKPPTFDPNIIKLNHMVKQIESDKSILKVTDICQKFGLEQRQLQRLFNKYIGVSAKWIINRYRIHEALDAIETTKNINWSDLALSLGYYDQAHFIKDFKNLIGTAPDGYLKSLKGTTH